MKKTIISVLLICLALLFAACDGEASVPSSNPKKPSSSPTTGSTGGTHAHAFGQWTPVNDATCTEDGLEERVCDCGEKEQQPISSPGHLPGEWITEKESSATEAGVRHLYCLVCNTLLQEEVIPATGTTGLSYVINDDNQTCTITGIGTCSDSKLVIPSIIDGYSVTAIRAWAFELCSNLYSVTIPNSVTNIGDGAFSNCTGLASVTLSNSLTTIPNSAFSHCTRLNSIIIPNSVTDIDYSAFSGCTALTEINIPNSVTYIGTVAFSGCTALSSITFPDSVTYVGENVLQNTAYFKNESNWVNDVLYAGNHVVAVKQTISGSRTIKLGTRTICAWAFRDCTALTGITIPNGVITIGGNAFYGCTALTKISFPDSITRIETSVLYNTGYYNDEANWDNGVLYAGNHVVATKEDWSGPCVLKPGTRTICDWAFSGRSGLTAITIPNSVTYIGQWAFASCSSLTTVDIPDSVTYIGEGAFRRCERLTSVTIGSGVTRLPYDTFFRCYALSTVWISGNVTSIDNNVFDDCHYLADIYFAGTKAQWEAITKAPGWNEDSGNYIVHCTDGDLLK